MAELIQRTDDLNTGREKLNNAILDAEDAKQKSDHAVNVSEQAKQIAQTAENKADNVQKQFNQVVIEGDSSVEAAQARVTADGRVFDTLRDRLNYTDTQLAETGDKIFNESLINHKRQRGMITIIDDDGFSYFNRYLYPLALEYGIPMTSAVITSWPSEGKGMSLEQIKEVYEGGMEIVNHTHTHAHLDQLSEEEIRYEFETSRDLLNSWGIKNHNIIVYPFGSSNELVRDIAREYFIAGFDIPRGGTYGQLNDYPMDMYNIRRTTIGYGFTEGLKAELNKAAEEGKWIIVMSHILQNEAQNHENWETTMRSLIEYALGIGLEFVTCRKGLEHHGNLAQFGGTKIGANGKVESEDLLLTDYHKYSDVYNSNNPITDFPKNRETVINVRDVDAVKFNLPAGIGGKIKVYRGDQDFYAFQEFTPRRHNKARLIRKWNVGNNSWNEWESVGLARNATEADYVPNAPITDFPRGEVTKITINASTSDDYLISTVINRREAGIVETHRAPSNVSDNWSYQMFHANNRNIILKRRWLMEENDWGRWFIVNTTVNPHDHNIPLDSPASAYPVGQKFLSKVMSADSHLLGKTRDGKMVGGYGLLETYVFIEYVYSYQVYYNRGDLKTYVRWWGTSDWSGWVEQTNS